MDSRLDDRGTLIRRRQIDSRHHEWESFPSVVCLEIMNILRFHQTIIDRRLADNKKLQVCSVVVEMAMWQSHRNTQLFVWIHNGKHMWSHNILNSFVLWECSKCGDWKTFTIADTLTQFVNANILFGPHGAGLMHVFACPHATVVNFGEAPGWTTKFP